MDSDVGCLCYNRPMGPGNSGIPNRSFNGAPQPRMNNYNAPPATQYNAEPSPANNFEKLENRVETKQNQAPISQNVEPTLPRPAAVAAVPVQQPLPRQSAVASTTASSSKTVDADALEKVWVDKAKDTIEKTKMDPHSEAHQIAELMKGYLKERYGKIVGEKTK